MIRLFTIATCLTLLSTAADADWAYEKQIDKMTSQQSAFARMDSVDELNLTRPYNGPNRGRLVVRKHARYGVDVMVTVDKGQIICSKYRGCNINVRFDDRPPMTFQGGEPEDYSRTTVFILNSKRFIAEAKKAKRILVGVTFHENGEVPMEFRTTKPLDWPP